VVPSRRVSGPEVSSDLSLIAFEGHKVVASSEGKEGREGSVEGSVGREFSESISGGNSTSPIRPKHTPKDSNRLYDCLTIDAKCSFSQESMLLWFEGVSGVRLALRINVTRRLFQAVFQDVQIFQRAFRISLKNSTHSDVQSWYSLSRFKAGRGVFMLLRRSALLCSQ
jgi:hypothetical protein